MKKLIIIALILFTATIAWSEVIVSGSKVIYTGNLLEPGKTVTESETAPTNPSINDEWRNISENIVYYWDGSNWKVLNLTADIQTEIDKFKDNIGGVDDPEAKKCLQALGKVVLKLYKEQ